MGIQSTLPAPLTQHGCTEVSELNYRIRDFESLGISLIKTQLPLEKEDKMLLNWRTEGYIF